MKIGIVGDYNASVIAHRAIEPAVSLAAGGEGVDRQWIPTEDIRSSADIDGFDGIWVVPNSPYRSTDGALFAIQTARELGIPLLGTCGGFQHAVLEHARNVLAWRDADHAELSPDSPRLVVTPLSCSLVEVTGGLRFTPGSRLATAYESLTAVEGYHCNFGMSPAFAAAVRGSALRITAIDDDGDPRAIELDGHPFFVGTLFQPERAALTGRVPPIVRSFVAAARAFSASERASTNLEAR